MKLEQLQAAFVQELRGDDNAALREQIVAGKLNSAQRLAIYRGNGVGACRKALQQIYPVCQKILGEAYFGQLALKYIATHPSGEPDLNVYGESWSQFLGPLVVAGGALSGLPYLSDLACLEWHYHAAYYADNDTAIDFVALQQVAPSRQDDICWQCSASLAVMQSTYPLLAIWHGNRGDNTVDAVAGLSEAQYLCIYRRGFELVVDPVDRTSYLLLQGIMAAKTMAQLSALVSAQELDTLLPQWVQCAWICGFKLAPASR